jgi:CRISPR-associated protein Csb1
VQPSTSAGFVLDASKETKLMSENAKTKITLTPTSALHGESPLVLTATLEPVAGLDRFQPAGFPEIGHVIYRAPRANGAEERVCIIDSAASMANHLESVCLRGAHDLELVEELTGMPYLRCVTGTLDNEGKLQERELVVTSLTEGHRIASDYFLGTRKKGKRKVWDGKGGQRVAVDSVISKVNFGDELADEKEFGIRLDGYSNAHPPTDKMWNVFGSIFKYDPNSLVHGVLFPQWQIKISRFLTAHLEAFGASRVDRSGVKFDRLGKTTSGQPIFAVDDATAQTIRATFVFDLSLLRSFGRKSGEKQLGLSDKQKEFLIALALWKVRQLLSSPFRFRSGCHLRCTSITSGDAGMELSVDIKQAIKNAGFAAAPITDVYWPREELYREGVDDGSPEADDADEDEPESGD